MWELLLVWYFFNSSIFYYKVIVFKMEALHFLKYG